MSGADLRAPTPMLSLTIGTNGGGFVGRACFVALLAMGLAGSACAEDLLGARTFVAQVYIKATNNKHFSFVSPRLLTPELYDLAQRAGDRGGLDYDPLCQCKDNDGLSAQILSVAATGSQAVARVRLRIDAVRPPPPQNVTLRLMRAPLAGWKIADIQTQRLPSLKAWLAGRAEAHPRQ